MVKKGIMRKVINKEIMNILWRALSKLEGIPKRSIRGRIIVTDPALSQDRETFTKLLDSELKGLREDMISAWKEEYEKSNFDERKK